MRKIAGGIAAALVAAALTIVGAAIPANAAHVSCGQTITQSTTLDGDVGPCSNNGIIIGANNITLNLNGFRVFGTAASGDGAGVLVLNRTGVTVTSGTVSDFDGGVAIAGGGGNTVVRINAHDNIGASQGHPPAPSTAWGDGIAVQGSNDNRILFNDVQNNGPFSGIGLFTGDTDHPFIPAATVEGNLIQGNNVRNNVACRLGPFCDNDGIRLEPRVGSRCLTGTTEFCRGRGNRVIGNTVERNGLDGIAVFTFATDNLVQGNTVNFNGIQGAVAGDGIRVFGYFNTISSNSIRGNTGGGLSVGRRPPSAAALPGNVNGRNNTLTRNVAARNGIRDLHDSNPNCDNNVWSGNVGGTATPPCTLNP